MTRIHRPPRTGISTRRPTRTDLHIVDHLPTNLNNLTVGDFWFQKPAQEFYRLVQRAGVRNLEQKHAEAGLAGDQTDTSRDVVFLGFVATDTAALRFTNSIFMGTDYFYIDSDTDEVKLLDNATFSGPGQTAHHYQYAEVGGGGSGTDTNDYADSAALAVSGQDLSLTIGRTGSLADLTAMVTLPAGSGTSSDDTKVVTALPDAVDVADDDKDKLWLVVPTADDGIIEVAHFAPADDPTVFKMTAQAFMQGPASYVGFDVTDNGGHLEPSDTNIERIAFGHTFDNYEVEFNENKTTPFDWNDFATDGITLYFREAGATGNWQRFRLTIPNINDEHEYGSANNRTAHLVAGKAYDVVIRTASVTSDTAVSTVPATSRLQSHPAGGAFKSFVDEDDLGHIGVVVETNREVDGEVDSVALAVAGQDLTLTVGRTVGLDLTATQTLPGGLPLTGGTLAGTLAIAPGDVNSVALTITKGDGGNNPVVRMVHPNNQTTSGQRPIQRSARRGERLLRGQRDGSAAPMHSRGLA